MKKEFKFVSVSVVGIVCASLMTSSFAASSVRSLGGVGTYAGTTSATQAASSTKSATTAARAGAIRVDGSTRVNSGSSLRTPSTRSATAPRLSIGKYLSTHSFVGTGGKLSVDLSTNETVTNMQGNIESLQQNIDNVQLDVKGLQEELQGYLKGVELRYDSASNELYMVSIVDGKEEEIGDRISLDDIGAADDALNNLISGGKMIDVARDEKTGVMSVSAKIVGALSADLKAEDNGLVTATQVVDYAIPKPQAECSAESSTCVLSVKLENNRPVMYWLELVDSGQPATIEETTQETEIVTE